MDVKAIAIIVTIVLFLSSLAFGLINNSFDKHDNEIANLSKNNNALDLRLKTLETTQISEQKLERLIDKSVKNALNEWELNRLKNQ